MVAIEIDEDPPTTDDVMVCTLVAKMVTSTEVAVAGTGKMMIVLVEEAVKEAPLGLRPLNQDVVPLFLIAQDFVNG